MGKSLSKPITKNEDTSEALISTDGATTGNSAATKNLNQSDGVSRRIDQSNQVACPEVIKTGQSEAPNEKGVFTKFRSFQRSISSLLFRKDNEDKRDNDAEKFSRQTLAASENSDRKRKGDLHEASDPKIFKMDLGCDKNLGTEMIVDSIASCEEPSLLVRNQLIDNELSYLNFPFLVDEKTEKFVHNSLVMLVMRGLPGSGKSTVVKKIKQKYPEAVSCSADDYFYRNGVYEFQKEKLKEAHTYCQEMAEEHCKQLSRVLIIDNTHVLKWEMTPYFKLANKYRYLVVLVEPKTPWRLNVDELFNRNSHNVQWDIINKRAELYQKNIISPYYFAWFLNLADSKILIESPQTWLRKCLYNCQDFVVDFQSFSNCYDIKSMLNYFDRDSCRGMAKNMCHCTAKFCGKDGKEFAIKQEVVEHLGEVTSLVITGFTITPRTIGAKVQLTEQQKLVYAQNDSQEITAPNQNNSFVQKYQVGNRYQPQYYGQKTSFHSGKIKNTQNGFYSDDDDPMELEEVSQVFRAISASKPSLKAEKSTKNRVTGGFSSILGRRAHITLGCAVGVRPMQTGLDIIDIAVKEDSEVANEVSEEDLEETREVFPKYKVRGGVLTNYGDGNWMFNLDKHIIVDAMFTGSWG